MKMPNSGKLVNEWQNIIEKTDTHTRAWTRLKTQISYKKERKSTGRVCKQQYFLNVFIRYESLPKIGFIAIVHTPSA